MPENPYADALVGLKLDDPVLAFFNFCREREQIRKNRKNGFLKPWSKDPIFQSGRFLNVFREDDRTTRWFRTHIREPMRNEEDVLMATIIFRWFNLIETGRTLIDHDLLRKWNRKKAICEITKQPKWITGAYIIKTPNVNYFLFSSSSSTQRRIKRWNVHGYSVKLIVILN